MIDLTKDQCESLIDFIEVNLFEAIRNDPETDSLIWLCNICEAYTKMKEYVGKEKNEEKTNRIL